MNSGLDGAVDLTDRPGIIRLQAEGHEVLYRNVWVEKLELAEADTDF